MPIITSPLSGLSSPSSSTAPTNNSGGGGSTSTSAFARVGAKQIPITVVEPSTKSAKTAPSSSPIPDLHRIAAATAAALGGGTIGAIVTNAGGSNVPPAATATGGASAASGFFTSIRSSVSLAWSVFTNLHFLYKLGLLALLYKPFMMLVSYVALNVVPNKLLGMIGYGDERRTNKASLDESILNDVDKAKAFVMRKESPSHASVLRPADAYEVDPDDEASEREKRETDIIFWAP